MWRVYGSGGSFNIFQGGNTNTYVQGLGLFGLNLSLHKLHQEGTMGGRSMGCWGGGGVVREPMIQERRGMHLRASMNARPNTNQYTAILAARTSKKGPLTFGKSNLIQLFRDTASKHSQVQSWTLTATQSCLVHPGTRNVESIASGPWVLVSF